MPRNMVQQSHAGESEEGGQSPIKPFCLIMPITTLGGPGNEQKLLCYHFIYSLSVYFF